jgi:hypothetical protein
VIADDPRARAALDSLLPLPRSVGHGLAPKRSALYARLLPPSELPPNERWDVDLDAALLTWSIDGAITTWCDAQLFGTFDGRDGSFLWGDRNPSVPPSGTARLARSMDAMDDLAALRAVPRFTAPFDELLTVAEWVAVRAGFLGIYPGPVGDTTALLAVSPRLRPEWPTDHPQNTWCTLCGATRFHVQTLIAGLDGNICSECVRHLLALRAASPCAAANPVDSEPMPELPPCFLSGSYGPRVFMPYTAVSDDALARCESIIGVEGAGGAANEK